MPTDDKFIMTTSEQARDEIIAQGGTLVTAYPDKSGSTIFGLRCPSILACKFSATQNTAKLVDGLPILF